MKLSVIIPVYQAEKTIAACLESVLSQGIDEMEVLCVDDASTDASRDIIREAAGKDGRIRLLENEKNLHAGPCRNRGIREAKGDYLHFLDADDLVAKGAYRRFLSAAEESGADLVKGRGVGFCDQGIAVPVGPLLELSLFPKEMLGVPFTFRERADLLSYVSVVPWNAIYRREAVAGRGIWFNSLPCVNDSSFYNEVTIRADKILVIPEVMVHYRTGQAQSLMGRRADHFDCQLASAELIFEQLRKYHVRGRNRRIVVDREVRDLMHWYGSYRAVPEKKDEIEGLVRPFMRRHPAVFVRRKLAGIRRKIVKRKV